MTALATTLGLPRRVEIIMHADGVPIGVWIDGVRFALVPHPEQRTMPDESNHAFVPHVTDRINGLVCDYGTCGHYASRHYCAKHAP